VSGNHITERQIRLYMTLRENFTQEVAASKSSISVSTAGRIEGNRHQPKKINEGGKPEQIHLNQYRIQSFYHC
jgi:hypothetical protein